MSRHQISVAVIGGGIGGVAAALSLLNASSTELLITGKVEAGPGNTRMAFKMNGTRMEAVMSATVAAPLA
jgi:glycine/D-amino acid oxidase-like deaminating enzyme